MHSGQVQSFRTSNKKYFKYTAAYYLIFFLIGFTWSINGPALPTLVEQTSSTLQEYGIVFLASSAAYIFGSLCGGRIFDHYDGHRVLRFTLFVFAGTIFLIPFLNTVWLLAIVFFTASLLIGFLEVGTNLLLIWLHGPKVGPYINGLHMVFGLGAFSGPVLAGQFSDKGVSIVTTYWVTVCIALPLIVFIWCLPLSTKVKQAILKPDESTVVINTLFPLGLLALIFAGVESGTGNWIFTYALQIEIATEMTSSYLVAAFWALFSIGRLVAIPLAIRVNPQSIVQICLIGCLISLLIQLALPTSMLALWVSVLSLALFLGPTIPNLFSLAERLGLASGKTTGLLVASTGGGGLTIPFLVSQLFDHLGPQVLPIVQFLSLLIALILYIYFLYHPRTI